MFFSSLFFFFLVGVDPFGFNVESRLRMLETGDEAGVCTVDERGEGVCRTSEMRGGRGRAPGSFKV